MKQPLPPSLALKLRSMNNDAMRLLEVYKAMKKWQKAYDDGEYFGLNEQQASSVVTSLSMELDLLRKRIEVEAEVFDHDLRRGLLFGIK